MTRRRRPAPDGPWFARIVPSGAGYRITLHTDRFDAVGAQQFAFTERGAERVGRRAAARLNRREARGRMSWTVRP